MAGNEETSGNELETDRETNRLHSVALETSPDKRINRVGNEPFIFPASYTPPDRERWAKEHGDAAPFAVPGVPRKFISRAVAALRRDTASIDFDKCMTAQTTMDAVNEDVQADALDNGIIDEDTLVFFDPQTARFFAYPPAP